MRQLKISQQITKRDTVSINRYLTEISRYHPVTAQREVELALRIRKGDEQALEELVNANLRFVVSVAKQYQHLGMSLEDMINEGNVGLITAARRFDHTKGFKFISYAVWWIRQSILKAAADHERTIRLPVSQVARISQINQARTKLTQTLEREPTAEELAEELEISEDKISATLSSSSKLTSLDKPLVEEETATLGEMLVNTDAPEADTRVIADSLRNEIIKSLSVLSKQEREIIELYFGLGRMEGMSLNELAIRYNLTVNRVQQIRDKALRQLRKSPSSQWLKSYLAN